MRSILLSALTVFVLFTISCSNANTKNEHENHDMSAMAADSSQHAQTDNKDVKTVAVLYTNLDPKASATIKEVVDHYLHVKNALTNDNASEAASGAKAMLETLAKMDKSLLTAEQKKAYDEVEEGLKEHAEHISNKADDIKHQRSHFVDMSEDIYSLVKSFGGGRPLYHDHCPMAKDNQGAMWISEMHDIKNPYFGSSMMTCGSVEEVIQ